MCNCLPASWFLRADNSTSNPKPVGVYQPVQAAYAAITKSNLFAKPADRAVPG